MEGLFLCNVFDLPTKSKKGTAALAKEYLQEHVPDFDPEHDYSCGISSHVVTTAIRWEAVKGGKETEYPDSKNGDFRYQRYYIVKFRKENDVACVVLEGESRLALVNAFEEKARKKENTGRNLDLHRVNINETIGSKPAKEAGE